MELPAEGTILAGRYRLLRSIGSGGMGAVFEGEHLKLRQRVAIKLLHPALAARADIGARFEREARAATQLTSPHVARVTDVDVSEDGTAFMVMEFLRGQDLSKELSERGALPITTAVSYVLQACDAMVEAHALGIVHRDLKPGNLFLAESAGRHTLKVLDFGISKVAAEEDEPGLTSTFSALGTALYMSPEQVRSAKRVDTRSDIWSLGVILFEALAGRPPFEGESATSVAASIVADPLPSLRALRPEVSEALEAVVYRALTKDREQRFQSMEAFAMALSQFGPETSRPSFAAISSPEVVSNPRISVDVVALPSPNTAPGWTAPPGSAIKARPRWLAPVAIAGGLLVLGLVAVFVINITKQAATPAAGSVAEPTRAVLVETPRQVAASADESHTALPASETPPATSVPPKRLDHRQRTRVSKPTTPSVPVLPPTSKPTQNPPRL